MTVKKLIELLQRCEPEATVTITHRCRDGPRGGMLFLAIGEGKFQRLADVIEVYGSPNGVAGELAEPKHTRAPS